MRLEFVKETYKNNEPKSIEIIGYEYQSNGGILSVKILINFGDGEKVITHHYRSVVYNKWLGDKTTEERIKVIDQLIYE